MHREVFAGRDGLLTVGEMPGVTVEQARAIHRPGAPRGRHGLPVRARAGRPGATKWDVRPLDLLALKASLGRWQAGLADVGWNSLYWNNHDQPRAVSRFGDDGEHRVRSAKALGTVLHLQRGTPYVYQGEELGMTNAPFASIDDFRDLESLNHYRDSTADGDDPEAVLAALRARAATTPARRCSGTPPSTPGSRPARRGCGEPQNHQPDTESHRSGEATNRPRGETARQHPSIPARPGSGGPSASDQVLQRSDGSWAL